MKRIYYLKGLGCANCASKMERGISSLQGVRSVSVDFVSKKLIIESDNSDAFSKIESEASIIIKNIETDVNMIRITTGSKSKSLSTNKESDVAIAQQEEHSDLKYKAIQIGIGSLFFTSALFFDLPDIYEIILFMASYIIIGGEILFKAFKNILKGQVFDENFLMSIATIGAISIGDYAEGVAVMLFYQVGEIFQDVAVERSRKSITALMDIRPDYANLKVGDDTKRVSPEIISINDLIIVRPGEKVPLDGIVVEGNSTIDTSALTGESLPVDVSEGYNILSGSINKNGLLTIKVTKEFSDSTVSKILDLVQNASSNKAPTENFITKFARYYTPIVVITALLLAFVPPIILKDGSLSDWIYRALIFLVVSCPCALVISIPLGFFGGIGASSKSGILVKGSNFLEALNKVDTVIFDKTGTLTKGVFNVTQIVPANNYTEDELLMYTAYTESYSNHPIALSVVKAYKSDIDNTLIDNYQEMSGYGIKASVRGKEVVAGNIKLMSLEGIDYNKDINIIGTTVHVAIDKIYAGYIVISDSIKEDSFQAIKSLKEIGIKETIMLTGDSKHIGDLVGKQLGIDQIYSELLPHEKVEKLESIIKNKNSDNKVIFVGDGINDAPVLARADIGIAMGGLGSDAAIEAADIVIMTDEPSKIAEGIKIARFTKKIVYQNIVFALVVKALVLILGASGNATMWEAVFADVGVALIAVINSIRTLRK